MWVYIRSEPNVYTVGYYGPNGGWQSDSDHDDKEGAAARVHYLNGGTPLLNVAALEASLDAICGVLEDRLEGPVERRRRGG